MGLSHFRLLSTPEFRSGLIGVLFLSLLLWSISGWMGFALLRRAGEEFDAALAGALGALPAEEETARAALVDAIVVGAGAGEIARGRQILEVYGYTEHLSVRRKKVLMPADSLAHLLWFLAFPLFVILPPVFFLCGQIPFFRALHKLTRILRSGLQETPERIEIPAHGGLWTEFLGRLDQLIRKLDSSLEKNIRTQNSLRDSLADISHQLKTPIATISLYNDLLLAEIPSRGEAADLLRRSRGAVTKLENLTRELLKLTRLEAGTIPFSRKPVDLRSLVEESWSDLLPLAGERIFTIKEAGPGETSIYADRAWLKEAVGNVLKNAVQQTRPDGKVTASIVSNPLFRRLVIADDGDGIPEADLPRLFERFFSRSNSPDMERTGIGLSMSREIMRGNGGDLRARNGREGAEFIFSFYD